MNLSSFQDVGGLMAFAQQNALVFGLFMIWSLFWKGLALWKSAKDNKPYWFVAVLILNTAGILEILYIFVFSKMMNKKVEVKKEE